MLPDFSYRLARAGLFALILICVPISIILVSQDAIKGLALLVVVGSLSAVTAQFLIKKTKTGSAPDSELTTATENLPPASGNTNENLDSLKKPLPDISIPIKAHSEQPQSIFARAIKSINPLALHNVDFHHPFVIVIIVFFVFAIAALVRFIDLDQKPAEWYGDISTVYEYVQTIRAGKIADGVFSLGIGPLYPATLSPFLKVLGTSYLSIKISAALLTMAGLGMIFVFAQSLINLRFALLATFISAISSWMLVYSRLGDVQALVPLVTAAVLWLILVIARSKKFIPIPSALCGLIAALGMYLYGATFMLPVISGVMLMFYLFRKKYDKRNFLVFAATGVVVGLPLVFAIAGNPQSFATGHFGSKLGSPQTALANLPGNFIKAMLAFVTQGDGIFRANPASLPHIDVISLIFMALGVIFWIKSERRIWGALLIVAFVLIQLPSMLVPPQEVPNAGRTIGAAPIAYILIASGMWWMGQFIQKKFSGAAATIALIAAVAIVTAINLQRYFVTYITGLPLQNTPVASKIVEYVDLLPKDTKIYLIGGGWAGGMPEPKSIRFPMRNPQNLNEIWPENLLTCETLKALPLPAVLIWNPAVEVPQPAMQSCKDFIPSQVYSTDNGMIAFRAASVRKNPAAGTNSVSNLPPQALAPNTPTEPPLGQRSGNPGRAEDSSQLVKSSQALPPGIEVWHQAVDMGGASALFDNDFSSLMRGANDNPFIVELRYSSPKSVSNIKMALGYMPEYKLTISLTGADGKVIETSQIFKSASGESPQPVITIPGGPVSANIIRIQIEDIRQRPGEGWHIHIFETQVE